MWPVSRTDRTKEHRKMTLRCPRCESDRIVTKDHARIVTCSIGAIAGVVRGWVGAASGAELGAVSGLLPDHLESLSVASQAPSSARLCAVLPVTLLVPRLENLLIRTFSIIFCASVANSASVRRAPKPRNQPLRRKCGSGSSHGALTHSQPHSGLQAAVLFFSNTSLTHNLSIPMQIDA